MTDKDFSEICDRLDKVIKLMVANIVSAREYEDQVWILSNAGFQPKEIAEFLGRTPNAVSVKLSELRKKRGVSRKVPQEKP